MVLRAWEHLEPILTSTSQQTSVLILIEPSGSLMSPISQVRLLPISA